MSRVRIHNFSISLDGFATGEGLTFDAPFGHAGHRLHEWMFATRFGGANSSASRVAPSGVDHAMADSARPRDRRGDHGRREVRSSGMAGRPGVAPGGGPTRHFTRRRTS